MEKRQELNCGSTEHMNRLVSICTPHPMNSLFCCYLRQAPWDALACYVERALTSPSVTLSRS